MMDGHKNKVNHYGNIITTIAIAVFLILWTTIDRRLQDLEVRLRSLEQKVTAISVQLGIDQDERYSGDAASPLHNQPTREAKLP